MFLRSDIFFDYLEFALHYLPRPCGSMRPETAEKLETTGRQTQNGQDEQGPQTNQQGAHDTEDGNNDGSDTVEHSANVPVWKPINVQYIVS